MRRMLPSALLLGLILLGGGCDRFRAPPLRLLAPADRQASLQEQLLEFTRQTGLRVEFLPVPENQAVSLEFRRLGKGGAAPDVVWVDSDDLPSWTRERTLQNLLPLHPDDPAFEPATLSALSQGGSLYAIPNGWSTMMLFYNPTLFVRQGVPAPTKPSWDWGDLLITAQMLTLENEDGVVTQHGLTLNPDVAQWLPWIWQNNGQILDTSGRWCLTDPQYSQSNAQAIDCFSDLIRTCKVAPPLRGSNPEACRKASQDIFIRRKAAMIFAPRDFAATLRQNVRFPWNIAPLPRGRQSATLLEVQGYGIAQSCARTTEAWRLISFLTRETAQAMETQQGRIVPSRMKLLASKIFLDFPGPHAARNNLYPDILAQAHTAPASPFWPAAANLLTSEMAALLTNPKLTVRDGMEQMQIRLEELGLVQSGTPKLSTRTPELQLR